MKDVDYSQLLSTKLPSEGAVRRVAIMQPYIFPYIGYFQLIASSDVFVIYDNVQYVKKSWVNRNRILLQERAFELVVPIHREHSKCLIKDVMPYIDDYFINKFFRRLKAAYSKAPHYTEVRQMLWRVLQEPHSNIVALCLHFIQEIDQYLGLNNSYFLSSELIGIGSDLTRQDKLIAIAKLFGAREYINSPGGKALYCRDEFKRKGLELFILSPPRCRYQQFGKQFVPNLSLIDVMMFNDPLSTRKMIKDFRTERLPID